MIRTYFSRCKLKLGIPSGEGREDCIPPKDEHDIASALNREIQAFKERPPPLLICCTWRRMPEWLFLPLLALPPQ